MEQAIKRIEQNFNKIISLKVRDVQLGHGSFLTMGFGKDLNVEVVIRKEKKITKRPEWFFWIYMCFWEIKINNEHLIGSDDDRDRIRQTLGHLENKKLLNIGLLSDSYDMELHFEDGVNLCLYANNDEDGNEQWMLFTPDKKVLTAGPFENLTYEDEYGQQIPN